MKKSTPVSSIFSDFGGEQLKNCHSGRLCETVHRISGFTSGGNRTLFDGFGKAVHSDFKYRVRANFFRIALFGPEKSTI